ncbi:MAG: zinc-ribbon domain-containing protein [Clostridia bacterium]|nr:zinc-ribbon domain-containing protein [Clostridia bacterium]
MYCKNCGKQIDDNTKYCTNCGTALCTCESMPIQRKGNIGWSVLAFFFPLIGFILYMAWQFDDPNNAKMAGLGTLIKVFLKVVLVGFAYLTLFIIGLFDPMFMAGLIFFTFYAMLFLIFI